MKTDEIYLTGLLVSHYTRTNRLLLRHVSLKLALALLLIAAFEVSAAGVTYEGRNGPGHGKHIVLVAGDDAEYHSEEALPQLAKILAVHHGFECTVLFSINPANGTIDPHAQNIPGLDALKQADLLVLFIRWRDLPDDQMKEFVDYFQSGRPIIAIRTGTHPFAFKTSKTYEKWSWNSTIPGWEGGFGRKFLGTTWEEPLGHYGHHGLHGKQSTRAWFAPGAESNPILRGIKSGEIWVPTEVYEVRLPQPPTCRALLLGQVLSGLHPDDPPVPGPLNDPMLPVAWTNTYTPGNGKTARVFASTMGAADDLLNDGLRRLLVNATYWAVGLENEIPEKSDVSLVGDYHPHSYLSETYTTGVKPSDLALPTTSDQRR
jgi:Trehalose utilisation